MKLNYTMVSETGLRRTNNEDAVLFVKPEKPWIEQSLGILAVVSDGMGGYERGEKASAMVVDLLQKVYYKDVGPPEEKLRRAAINVNNAIAIEGFTSSIKMGATCTATVILDDQIVVLHIGDSRCYLFKNGALQQITQDHTAANEMARSESLNASERTLLFNPHALTKAMGIKFFNSCQADVFPVKNDLVAGDRILLCSDGVFLHIENDELNEILQERQPIKATSNKMVKLILQRGALDNFSFILIEVE